MGDVCAVQVNLCFGESRANGEAHQAAFSRFENGGSGKLEAAQANNPSVERLCWYIFGDGSGGLTVIKAIDVDAANAWGLEVTLALSEYLEFESHVVLDMDTAMPAILKAVEHANG